MKLLAWWKQRRREREREAASVLEMRRVDDPKVGTPSETYLSQTRD